MSVSIHKCFNTCVSIHVCQYMHATYGDRPCLCVILYQVYSKRETINEQKLFDPLVLFSFIHSQQDNKYDSLECTHIQKYV